MHIQFQYMEIKDNLQTYQEFSTAKYVDWTIYSQGLLQFRKLLGYLSHYTLSGLLQNMW